ncbi:hypothetical protein BASA81_010289 [Batrachochytrium salamandrivorans]|nr:hypothetical protein BASA81_010289 [Batrachochytrium salamandrivorans]
MEPTTFLSWSFFGSMLAHKPTHHDMFRCCKTNSTKTKPMTRRKEVSTKMPPQEDAWERHETATHVFYYNVRTQMSTWVPPPPGSKFVPVPPPVRFAPTPPAQSPVRFLPTPPATPRTLSLDYDAMNDEEDRVKKSL